MAKRDKEYMDNIELIIKERGIRVSDKYLLIKLIDRYGDAEKAIEEIKNNVMQRKIESGKRTIIKKYREDLVSMDREIWLCVLKFYSYSCKNTTSLTGTIRKLDLLIETWLMSDKMTKYMAIEYMKDTMKNKKNTIGIVAYVEYVTNYYADDIRKELREKSNEIMRFNYLDKSETYSKLTESLVKSDLGTIVRRIICEDVEFKHWLDEKIKDNTLRRDEEYKQNMIKRREEIKERKRISA